MNAGQHSVVAPRMRVKLLQVELNVYNNSWQYINGNRDGISLSPLAVSTIKGDNLLEMPSTSHSAIINFMTNSRWNS